MQIGLPISSNRDGAIPEIIDQNRTGFIVEKHDINELAGKMSLLINSPELRRNFSENSRNKFMKHYTLEIFERKMAETFQTLLKLKSKIANSEKTLQ